MTELTKHTHIFMYLYVSLILHILFYNVFPCNLARSVYIPPRLIPEALFIFLKRTKDKALFNMTWRKQKPYSQLNRKCTKVRGDFWAQLDGPT